MNIHEHQAKRLLRSCGIRVPEGGVARTPDAAREVAIGLKGDTWMVKAQIHAGGRGNGTFADGSSGIRRADSPDIVAGMADSMLGERLVTDQTGPDGLKVKAVYVECFQLVDREFGLGLVVDERSRSIALLLSGQGGVEFESTASRSDTVHRLAVHPVHGPDNGQIEALLSRVDLDGNDRRGLHEVMTRLAEMFRSRDATLMEINPIGLAGGRWVALDAKMVFDRNALFRQPEILAMEQEDRAHEASKEASMDGFNYREMAGDVACISVGAGLSMATLDAIRHCGGEPANFLDLPPDSRVNRFLSALELVLSNRNARSLMINVFGGGIMRCDTVSDAITLIQNSKGIDLPMAVRLAGTNARLANRRLKEAMPHVFLADNMSDAARHAVSAAQRGEKPRQITGSPSIMSRLLAALRPR